MERVTKLYRQIKTFSKALFFSVFVTLPLRAEPVVVAALGDSLTHGYGLALEDGFVPQLEAWLRAQGHDVILRNAGVSGDTTQGGLARVDWTLDSEVEAMIVALGGNDMLRGIDPAVSHANLAGILKAAQAKNVEVLLVGMSAPLNYGADYKTAFEAMYVSLAQDYDVALAPDFFEGLQSVAPNELGRVMQGDGIHPNREGVTLIVAALGPYVADLVAQAQ